MRKRIVLGLAIRAIREAKSNQDEAFLGSRFAIACGMSHGYLCNIEAGRKQPPEDVTLRIAAQLDVAPDAISYVLATAEENAA